MAVETRHVATSRLRRMAYKPIGLCCTVPAVGRQTVLAVLAHAVSNADSNNAEIASTLGIATDTYK